MIVQRPETRRGGRGARQGPRRAATASERISERSLGECVLVSRLSLRSWASHHGSGRTARQSNERSRYEAHVRTPRAQRVTGTRDLSMDLTMFRYGPCATACRRTQRQEGAVDFLKKTHPSDRVSKRNPRGPFEDTVQAGVSTGDSVNPRATVGK